MTRLDTRKERPLTSREIAKIFGGFIGGAVGSGLATFWRCSGPGEIGGLLQWCQAGQVVTAIEWVCDHWVELVTAVVAEDARTCARGQA